MAEHQEYEFTWNANGLVRVEAESQDEAADIILKALEFLSVPGPAEIEVHSSEVNSLVVEDE